MRLLRRRFLDDLAELAWLLNRKEQEHLRQPADHQTRGRRAAHPDGTQGTADGTRFVRRILPGIHEGDEPLTHWTRKRRLRANAQNSRRSSDSCRSFWMRS